MVRGEVSRLLSLAEHIERVSDVSQGEAYALFLDVELLQRSLDGLKLALLRQCMQVAPVPVPDRMLDLHEVTKRLKVNEAWVRRNQKALPFLRRLSRKQLVASERELEQWMQNPRESRC